MNLAVEGAQYLEILITVLPLFKSELVVSRAATTRGFRAETINHDRLDNFFSGFRYEAETLGLHLDDLRCEHPSQRFETCLHQLRSVLGLFEELLSDQLLSEWDLGVCIALWVPVALGSFKVSQDVV